MLSYLVVYPLLSIAALTTTLRTFDAIIRLPNNVTVVVTIEAKDLVEARKQIPDRYCAGEDCIVDGPWERR